MNYFTGNALPAFCQIIFFAFKVELLPDCLRGEFLGWGYGREKNSPRCSQRKHKMQNSEREEHFLIKASFDGSLKVETRGVVIEQNSKRYSSISAIKI